jgi:hypothetical protein
MKSRRAQRWAIGLLAAGAIAAGCGASFDPYNRLKTLRVLAIRTEPVTVGPGETTTIDAKIYTPDPTGALVKYHWTWCPFAGVTGGECPVTEDQASMLAGVSIRYDLHDESQASFTHVIPPEVLTTLCAGMPNAPAPDCTDGFPIEIKLTASQVIDGERQEVQAVRPLRLRFRPTDQPNPSNPTIGGLYAVLGDSMPALDAAMATLPRHTATVIGAVIPPEDSEPYMGADNDGNPIATTERLNISWFVESGDTDHQRTSFIDGQVTLDAASHIKWTPAFKKDYGSDTSQVIVIIRDDRQGAGWTDGSATLAGSP